MRLQRTTRGTLRTATSSTRVETSSKTDVGSSVDGLHTVKHSSFNLTSVCLRHVTPAVLSKFQAPVIITQQVK